MKRKIILIFSIIVISLTGCMNNSNSGKFTSEHTTDLDSITTNYNEKEFTFKKESRKEISLEDAILGTWILDDQSKIVIDGTYLWQGDKRFKYTIENSYDDRISISVFAIEGLFIKEKRLFQMLLTFDASRCNAYIKRMFPQLASEDIVFQYQSIYMDKEGTVLGNFDDLFFE